MSAIVRFKTAQRRRLGVRKMKETCDSGIFMPFLRALDSCARLCAAGSKDPTEKCVKEEQNNEKHASGL